MVALVAGVVSFASIFIGNTLVSEPECCDRFYYTGWPITFITSGGFAGITKIDWSRYLLNTVTWFGTIELLIVVFRKLRR